MTPSSERLVVLVSTVLDLETDAVTRSLCSRGVECVRFNTDAFPFGHHITWECSDQHDQVLRFHGRQIQPYSVWVRKIRGPAQPHDMSTGIYDFCRSEAYHTIRGSLLALQGVRSMSPIDRIWTAENKLLQLSVARKVGLDIPRTMITNRPQSVLDAYAMFGGRMVCKPVHSGYVDDGETGMAIYTSQVLEQHLANVESAAFCPSIYQELLDKEFDVRVTWVGGRAFAASIDSQSDPSSSIDWRATTNPQLGHDRISLPPSIVIRIERLMSALGLSYGALDFVKTRKGEWKFLEVNPNGQWLWLDDFLDFGITDAVANWLSGERV